MEIFFKSAVPYRLVMKNKLPHSCITADTKQRWDHIYKAAIPRQLLFLSLFALISMLLS